MKNQTSPLAPRRQRDYAGVLSSILAILAGLLVGLIVLLATNPSNAFLAFSALITGGFYSGMKTFGNVLYYAVPTIPASTQWPTLRKTAILKKPVNGTDLLEPVMLTSSSETMLRCSGDTLKLSVYRQGQTLELTVTVAEQKQSALEGSSDTQQSQQQDQSQQQQQQGGGYGFPWGFGFGG